MNVQRLTLRIAFLFVLTATAALAYPTARVETAMAYDAASRQIILFGGATGYDVNRVRQSLGDTWAWTGRRWIRLYPEHSPEARAGHSMVYDSNRSRIVLFGGAVVKKTVDDPTTQLFNDTWVYQLGNWKKIETPNSPSPRRFAATTFDPVRDRVVLYGGSNTTTALYDTWEFDGTTWTQVSSDNPKLRSPLMVFDKKRDEVLLLGTNDTGASEMYRYKKPNWEKIDAADIPKCILQSGAVYQEHSETVLVIGGLCSTSAIVDEVHEWNGEKWTKIAPQLSHGSAHSFALTYDPIRQETLFFGGADYVDERSLTIRYRDGKFVFGADAFTPGPRSLFVFERDPERGVIWLYGGRNERGEFVDLWKYSAGRWESVTHADQPTGCIYPVGAFDSDRKRLVILCEDSSTFEWDGEKWYKFADLKDRPPSRRFGMMTYDANLKKSVLFGGYNGSYLKETWTWDGTKWTEIDAKKEPPSRMHGTLFYDPNTKKTILFSGIGRPNNDASVRRYTDQWSFDGSNWTEMTPSTKPSSRYGTFGDVDPTTGKFVMFGGKNEVEEYLNEMWEWDGTNWSKVERPNPPSPRMNGGLAVDPVTGRLTLYGGYAGGHFSEVWVVEPSGWSIVPEIAGRRRTARGRL